MERNTASMAVTRVDSAVSICSMPVISNEIRYGSSNLKNILSISTDTTCEANDCENVCHKTPVGPVCSCRTGYKLSADDKTCEDIDECQNNVCQQLCENQPGSFHCSCYEGYALRINRVSCKATG